MLRPWRWPSRVICRNREPSPRISRASSPRIRRFNSFICRRFGPCSHWTLLIRQRRFKRCTARRAMISPLAASASSDASAASIPSTFAAGVPCGGQPAQAAAEFQRILDHRSIVLVDPMDAMARLQLARALALSGDVVKAKRAYDDLFALWKNADPKISMVEEARAEYARLP